MAAVTLNQCPLDWSGNRSRIIRALESLRRHSPPNSLPDLLLFPELSLSGYACEDAFHSPRLWQDALESAQETAKACQKILPSCLVILGLPFPFRGGLYNCSALLGMGRILALVPKSILANNGVHYEARWFCSFKEKTVHILSLDMQEEKVPFGLMAFSHRNMRFIIENCRDAWGLARPAYSLRDSDFDMILNPSASCFSFDKYKLRRNLVLESSRRFSVHFVLANLLGCEAGSLLYDGHILAASDGQAIGESLSFSFQDFICGLFQFDVGPNRLKRAALRFAEENETLRKTQEKTYILEIEDLLEKEKTEKGRARTQVLFLSPEGPREDREDTKGGIKEHSKNEQFLQAISLGLFDYMRKSKARAFALSLSGGADSSACALLVHCAFASAISELGPEKALERLGRRDIIKDLKNKEASLKEMLKELMPQLLYTLYQATKNNSEESRKNAREVAILLSSTHRELEIEAQLDSYLKAGESLLGEKLEPSSHDLALQNIQARARAPLVWLLANLKNAILLCTANRSEIAVGYSTMDGDMAGGLAPIASLSKTFILEWLSFMGKEGSPLLGPMPIFAKIAARKPSAELRAGQSDEEDLMPYELLDKIIDLAIRERRGAKEILEILLSEYPEKYEKKMLEKNILRFFQLFSKSQWKRERLAPAFHIEEENLNPRVSYRFPILNALVSDSNPSP